MTLELDHVLVFVEPDVPEAAALEAAGFVAKGVHPHPGQGTANRSVLFAENFLELIYLSSRVEAEGNVMRLDRRADWRRTGACPFGFGLRGPLPAGARSEFWAYHPPYGTPGRPPIWVHRSHHETPETPLVFVMEPSAARPLERMRPRAWLVPDLVCGANGTTGIARVALTSPTRPAWPAGVLVPGVEVRSGSTPHATVELDAEPFPAIEAGSLLTVTSRRR